MRACILIIIAVAVIAHAEHDACPHPETMTFPTDEDRHRHAQCAYQGNPCNHTLVGWEAAGYIFSVADEGALHHVRCGARYDVTLSAVSVDGLPADSLEIVARLVSLASEPATVIGAEVGAPSFGGGNSVSWQISHAVAASGCFALQVRIAWVAETYLGHSLPDTRVCFRGGACPRPVRMCSRADFLSRAVYEGRWVSPDALDATTFYPHNFGFLYDECDFNRLVWAPLRCLLRSFDAAQTRRCAPRFGIGMGDSIPREQFTNMVQLLAGSDCFPLDGRLLSCGLGYCTHDPEYHVGGVDVVHVSDVRHANASVVLVALPAVRTLAGLDPGDERSLVDLARTKLHECEALGNRTACLLFVGSAVHRPREDRMFAASLNGGAVRRLAAALRAMAAAEFPATPVVDAYALTHMRWYASWDGTHHSKSIDTFSHGHSGFSCQWQGGVSRMVTFAFLNAACGANERVGFGTKRS